MLLGAGLGAILLGWLSPILYTYIGASIAYEARALGERSSILVAMAGYLLLFVLGVAFTGSFGAFLVFLWDKITIGRRAQD